MVFIYPNKKSVEEAIEDIECAIKAGIVSGIDISISGLLDHIMFVYGYDDEYFYVLDTHQVPGLEYEKTTQDSRYIMKISKETIKRRWNKFGRVWIVKKL